MNDVQSTKRISSISAIVLSLGMVACTTVETQSFRASGNPAIDSAYIATDADFSKYDSLLVDDMGIFFPARMRMSEEELTRIRQIFRDAFTKELGNYRMTREPGPGMLRVSASLVDLRNATFAELPNMRADMRDVAQAGELLFLMELKDSGTDRVLARAADSASAPNFTANNIGETDWAAVESAARRWAAIFRTFLDQNLGN